MPGTKKALGEVLTCFIKLVIIALLLLLNLYTYILTLPLVPINSLNVRNTAGVGARGVA